MDKILARDMHRVVPCPGSFRLSIDCPKDTRMERESDKSVLAHWLMNQCILLNRLPESYLGTMQTIDLEMIEHVNGYLNHVRSLFLNLAFATCVENKLVTNEFEGTPDYLTYNSVNKTVKIVIFEYDFTIVYPFENWNLISYFWLWKSQNPHVPVTDVEFSIYQPRPQYLDNPVKEWKITASSLESDYFPKIVETLILVNSPNASVKTGFHCRHCSAMLYCQTNLEACTNVVDIASTPCANNPNNSELGKQFRMFQYAQDLLKMRIIVLQTIVESKIKKGEFIPGYAMMPSNQRRVWIGDKRDIFKLGVPCKESEPLSPRQAELVGMSKDIVDANTKMISKIKLTRVGYDKHQS